MVSLSATKEEEAPNFAPKKMMISTVEYHQMGEAGVFKDKPRVELINGEIFIMSPLTPNHAAHTKKVDAFFSKNLGDKVLVGCQDPVKLNDFSEPEPDISILKSDENFYFAGHPAPSDIYLLIEVAVFTLKHDRTIKKKSYAESNIPEYWIVIPTKQIIEVYREPNNGKYIHKSTYQIDDTWTFEAFDLEVKGSDFLIDTK
jgi:Uma2 family endonuclease